MHKIRFSIAFALLVAGGVRIAEARSARGTEDICQAAGCSGGSLLCGVVTTTSTRLVLLPYLWVYIPYTEKTQTQCFEKHDEM